MNRKDFKEAWRKASKEDRRRCVLYVVAMGFTIVFILGGVAQTLEYTRMMPDEYRWAIGGAFITAMGFWLQHVFFNELTDRRIIELKKRIEELEGKHDNQNRWS